MTEKQLCSDCKHLKHDGMAGIWCGVRGNNKNYDCPKFEYNWGILTKEEAINHLNRLYYENEQLKADNNRLVNETARIVAEHQGRVLDLIDEKIDKCEPIDYARNIEGDVPVFDCETATEIRVLNELKKELEDD